MAAGEAARLHRRNRLRTVILDRHNRIRRHEMWARNPFIQYEWDRVSPVNRIVNGPGVRPYIAYKFDGRWEWLPFKPTPATIYFETEELEYSSRVTHDFVVIEPNIKDKASPNKRWHAHYWDEVIHRLRDQGLRPTQFSWNGSQTFPGVEVIETPTFRIACAVLAKARAAVLSEGGLHHAAAAVSTPAVVIYGGFISPEQTGYDIHRNLFTGGVACGARQPCKHCAKAMAAITPDMVMQNLTELLNVNARLSG